MMVMNTGSEDLLQWMISGEIAFSIMAKSPPAIPVNAPATTNAVHRYRWMFTPRKEARWLFSRIALSVEPKGEERTRRSSSTCLLYTSDAADDLLCVDLG